MKKQKSMKRKVTFELPWPPSVNQMYGRNKRKIYLAPKTKKFYADCKIMLLVQKVPRFYNKVTMLIEFFPSRSGGWDASNHFKAPEDALVKNGIILDDQVKYLQPLAPVIHKKIKNRFIKVTLEEV